MTVVKSRSQTFCAVTKECRQCDQGCWYAHRQCDFVGLTDGTDFRSTETKELAGLWVQSATKFVGRTPFNVESLIMYGKGKGKGKYSF